MFGLSDEQRMFRESLSRFLVNVEQSREADCWQGLAEIGAVAALFDEDLGGFGGDGGDILVVFDALGRMHHPPPLMDLALVPGWLLAAARWDVGEIISGRQRLAFAHGEIEGRYALDWVETRAISNRLVGDKTLVVGASEADGFLVSARDSNQGEIGLWWVAPDAPGLRLNEYALIDGGTAAELHFAETPGEPVLTNAWPAIASANAVATLAKMAETLGAMEKAVELTQNYLGTRQQFGRPIGHFQALAHRLVDVMVELEQARSAVLFATEHLNADEVVRDRHISAAKYLIGRIGRMIAEESIQMHGGMGMTEEYGLGHFVKRIIMADHRFGDTDYHLERFIELGG